MRRFELWREGERTHEGVLWDNERVSLDSGWCRYCSFKELQDLYAKHEIRWLDTGEGK